MTNRTIGTLRQRKAKQTRIKTIKTAAGIAAVSPIIALMAYAIGRMFFISMQSNLIG